MSRLDQGRSKVVAAFGRKPLNFRIPSGLAATLEQPCGSTKSRPAGAFSLKLVSWEKGWKKSCIFLLHSHGKGGIF
jgi:hypothetical protein